MVNTNRKIERPPVIAIMGHVNHGKTTLLDCIRNSNLVSLEKGLITQNIGIYNVKTRYGIFTFIDTPGHSAFFQMRKKGISYADFILLVIAVDDGIMEQTKEIISYAKLYCTPILIAINKIDKSNVNYNQVISNLKKYKLFPQDMGGETLFVAVSAKYKKGIDDLLQKINLQKNTINLEIKTNTQSYGIIIDSKIKTGLGTVTTILVRNGNLKKGDIILADNIYSKIKNIFNMEDVVIHVAKASVPAKIIGISGILNSGIKFVKINPKNDKEKKIWLGNYSSSSFKVLKNNTNKCIKNTRENNYFNIILKTDTQGSVEVIKDIVKKLRKHEFKIRIINYKLGDINKSDINLGSVTQSTVIGFNIKCQSFIKKLSKQNGVQINIYYTIYELIDYFKIIISSNISNKMGKEKLGSGIIKTIFYDSCLKVIAGVIVTTGFIALHNPIEIFDKKKIIYKGKINSLKQNQKFCNKIQKGNECGLSIKSPNNVLKTGNLIYSFKINKKPT